MEHDSYSFLPGVFGDYYSSSVIYNSGRTVGIAAKTVSGTPLTKYSVSDPSDCEALFGQDGGGVSVNRLVATAMLNGCPEVTVIPVEDDGDYSLAFSDFIASGIDIITCDSASPSVLCSLHTAVTESCDDGIRCIGIGSIGEITSSEASELMAEVCSERLAVTLSPVLSCAVAGVLSSLEDVTVPCVDVELKNVGLSDGVTSDRYEADQLLSIGVSPAEESAGRVRLVRCVSTAVENNGAENNDFMSINTTLISDNVISYVTDVIDSALLRSPSGGLSRNAVVNTAMIALSSKYDEGVIDDFDTPQATPVGSSDALLLELSFRPVGCINHISIVAHLHV